MLINANSNTLKTKVLIEEYLKLIQSGIEAEKILVLVQNSKKKKEFIDEVKKISPEGNIGCLKIFSFYGLARDFILENWALVENSIPDEANIKIIPSLSGLEITQKIIKDAIEEVDFSGYNSKTSLLHQLFRRISLINLNNLTKDEIEKRSRILKEGFSREVNSLINIYKAKTISLRAFDYIRQLNVFEFLYKKVKNNFEYVFLDDGDEITPCVLAYLEYIKPDVKEFFISYDPMGSSRLGYLGAINVDFEKFLDKKATRLKRLNLKIEEEAVNIFNSVKNKELINIKSIKTKSFLKRNEMTECVLEDIKKLILSGVKPYEISIVTPNCDNFLKSEFGKSGFNFNFISKNEKLNENKLISYILELLKIINDTKNTPVSPYVLKGIFIELLKIDKKEALKTIREYIYQSEFKNISIFEILEKKENEKFQKLVEIHNSMRFKPLSEQIYKIAEEFIVFEKDIKKDIVKLNEILKQISDYENVLKIP